MSSVRIVRTDRSCLRPAFRSGPWCGTRAHGCIAGQRRRPTAYSLRSARVKAGASCVTPSCLQQVAILASSLLGRGLGPGTPIVIISGNSVDHGLLALAAQYVGVPIVPFAEQYSLVPDAYPRLQYAIETVRPKMVFADDGAAYDAALALPFIDGIEKVVGAQRVGRCDDVRRPAEERRQRRASMPPMRGRRPGHAGKNHLHLGLDRKPERRADDARHAVRQPGADGCRDAGHAARPPKMLDWLPWNHVFGGSHNFNMMLANGGSLYIDEGKPTKAGFAASVRNIREHAGNLAFNVPIGFAQLVAAMEKDKTSSAPTSGIPT